MGWGDTPRSKWLLETRGQSGVVPAPRARRGAAELDAEGAHAHHPLRGVGSWKMVRWPPRDHRTAMPQERGSDTYQGPDGLSPRAGGRLERCRCRGGFSLF